MLIKAITTKISDGWGRIGYKEVLKGRFKGADITIERYGFNGNPPLEKHYTFCGKDFQKIFNKTRNKEGNFDRIG